MRPHGPMIVLPGAARITLVLLAVLPAAMAYPWRSAPHRVLLGAAVGVVIVLLSWWRGRHVTTILGRRLAMLRRNRGERPAPASRTDARLTVLLRVAASAADPDALPLELISGYVDRYGLRAHAIRVTSRDTASDTDEPRRETWIGLTLSAAENLAALRARSPQIPLPKTAEVAARRLADHLRESGWTAGIAAPEDIPPLLEPSAPETWRAIRQGSTDYVAAYRVSVDAALPATLAAIWSLPARETWTALEIAGVGSHRTAAVACAFRTDTRPGGSAPLPGLTPHHGNHRPALRVLRPTSTQRLDGHTAMPEDLLTRLRWPATQTAAGPAARGQGSRAGGLAGSRRL
ncbi:type VII secretion protein EccE [Mycobacterium sp. SM1]|uniref:type VII secretion protein EccE n=1 Tax=Mycobacterium sp. SM1 TaxID=2816243 RepID=UPI001BD093A6|nr:type VII secretion protein EccE [Mycobacterium sp. SM1]MBS4728339.1 type VII secretion protein EccE [Mycobacterium sp. SM1]